MSEAAFSLRQGYAFGGAIARVITPSEARAAANEETVTSEDERWMREAFLESLEGVGITNPNPAVGCVIVKNGREIGRGHTQRYGGWHAERVAFASVADPSDLEGATAFVTLEPCAHFGKQPPCVELLARSPVARVVFARLDSDPRVAGRGLARLREAGKTVVVGPFGAEVTAWNFPFFAAQALERPVFALKWAQTMDGQFADDAGQSQWITGKASRSYAHWLRQRYDAIMVGAGTYLLDLPRLTARDCAEPIQAQPVRIVIDPKGKLFGVNESVRTAIEAAVAASPAPLCIVTTERARDAAPSSWRHRLESVHGVHLIVAPVDLGTRTGTEAISNVLSEKRTAIACGKPLQSVLVEGGPKLLSALIKTGLADLLHVFVAPAITGGTTHRLCPGRLLADAPRFKTVAHAKLGDDVLMEMIPYGLFDLLGRELVGDVARAEVAWS